MTEKTYDKRTSETTSSSSFGGNTNLHYNTPPIQIGNQIRDGDKFVLLVQSSSGQGFQVWSSGDKQTTEQLYSQARTVVTNPEMAT
jgi:hypothetical protein